MSGVCHRLHLANFDLFRNRNKNYLKAQKRKHNQQHLCKVRNDVSFILSFFLSNFHHLAKFFRTSKMQHFTCTETLEKLSKKEEQCTLMAAESESLRSQLAGD